MKAVFLDKDGTLIENVPHNVDPALVHLTPRAGEGLRRMRQLSYRLFVVSNQPGVALGHFREEDLAPVEARIRELLRPFGVEVEQFYYCPHHPRGGRHGRRCDCRKPAPGLLRRAAAEHGIEMRESWLIGDILHDIEAGTRAGCSTILLDVGNETEWFLSPLRRPDYTASDLRQAAEHIAAATSREQAASQSC